MLHRDCQGYKLIHEPRHIYFSFFFRNDNQIITPVSYTHLDVYKRQGQSGSGKTVLMKCIVGLLTPEKGELLYDHRNFLTMGKKEKKALRLSLIHI